MTHGALSLSLVSWETSSSEKGSEKVLRHKFSELQEFRDFFQNHVFCKQTDSLPRCKGCNTFYVGCINFSTHISIHVDKNLVNQGYMGSSVSAAGIM